MLLTKYSILAEETEGSTGMSAGAVGGIVVGNFPFKLPLCYEDVLYG